MKPHPSSRREFLGTAVAGLSLAQRLSGKAARPANARVIGANDRINFGMIGVGGMGFGHVRQLVARGKDQADVQVVAASDIYTRRKKRTQEYASLAEKDLHHDYRELLARSDVDAVVIATPDHWHARMAIDALNARKDVYLQKPMTYTIEEAHDVAAAVERTQRVLQVGSQHTSDLRFHRAKEVIEKGWIGAPLWFQGTYSRNSIYGEWNYKIEDDGDDRNIDWKAFLGSAPKRAFSQDRYFRWRKYWDYSGGIATDLLYHKLAPFLLALGPQFPVRVTANGGIYVHKDREVPDTYSTTVEYENFYAVMSSSMASAAGNQGLRDIIYGHDGSIQFLPNQILVTPERQFRKKFADATGKDELTIEVEKQNIGELHMENFLASVRSRQQPVFNAAFGYRVMAAIKLGVDSYRQNKLMAFDPKSEKVIKTAPKRPGYEGTGK
ncbi:MAG: Gfo/Idh/MocA family oxidoreductase, partial [Acidobacteria bacterium]|nr:Gfo/Idh/MocA family oxidoreductase [Acidobacteriota bacterium]